VNEIDGFMLSALDSDVLRDMGIPTFPSHAQILKAIYELKVKTNSIVLPSDYIPDSRTNPAFGGPQLTVFLDAKSAHSIDVK
jgi:hypothetical protein